MISKSAAIVALIVVASLLVAGCTQTTTTSTTNQTSSATPSAQSDKTTFSSDRGYNITYPRTWTKDVNTSASSQVNLYLTPNPSNTIDGVDVATEKLNATTGTTLQDYYNYVVGNGVNGISSYKDYALLSFERTTLAGQPANKFVWQAMVPQKIDNTYQNTPLRAMQVLTVYNSTAFVVTYKTTQSDYNKYLTQAQETIDSFKFTS